MRIHKNERIIPVDIDDTLVMHQKPLSYPKQIVVEDPHFPGKFIRLGINEPMVKVLMDEKKRGAHIIAWSRSGYAWAETVLLALNLKNYVDDVYTKPLVYLDDKDVSEWLKDRVYINPAVTYKKHAE